MKYILVASRAAEERFRYDTEELFDLEEKVNGKIEEGYSPLGGVAVRPGATRGAYLLQAMVKGDK